MKIKPIQILTLLLFGFISFSASALSLFGNKSDDALLAAEEAFLTQATLDEQNRLNVEINIAPGYFVYRSKIKVSADQVEFGEIQIPDGVKKQDQFFGEVETYRGVLNYTAPITSTGLEGPIDVHIQSQGCADVGICYPPFSKIITVNAVAQADIQPADQPDIGGNSTLGNNQLLSPLEGISANRVENISSGAGLSSPVSSAVTDSSPSSGSTSTLGSMLQGSNDDEEILDPEVAFTIDPTAIENGSIALKWNVHEGYFLYRDRFSFKLISPDNATIGEADVSRGKIKQDEFFGEVEVIRNTATANIPITLPENVSNATLKVGYQGCADVGICFPPIYKEINLVEIVAVARSQSDAGVIGAVSSGNTGSGNTGVGAASATTSTATNTTLAAVTDTGSSSNIAASTSANAPLAQQDVLANSLKNNNRWITIATFFGLGLLLTFTPCVLPMIPILSSIIVGSGDKISTGRAFSLSLVYVLAMAATYTVAGVLVGLSGENIQGILQHPFVLSAIALLFVILAASMFGMFEFQMPAFVQNRLSAVSNKQKSGSFGGVATMGFLSALIVGPCITAPLVGALIYIGQTGDAVLGGAALFALSMGMGLPLLIIGTTFGKFLPRAGASVSYTHLTLPTIYSV